MTCWKIWRSLHMDSISWQNKKRTITNIERVEKGMKLRKVAAVTLCAGLLTAIVSGCGRPEPKPQKIEYDGRTFNIGVIRMDDNGVLDQGFEGFKAAMRDKAGDNVVYFEENLVGSDENVNVQKVAKDMVNNGLDAIVANSPVGLKTASDVTLRTPIIGTGIPDICETLKIYEWAETTGMNVNAVSSLAPFDEQADLIKEAFPDKKTVGIFYDGHNDYAAYQAEKVMSELEQDGYTCSLYSFDDVRMITATVVKAADENDIVYIPYDSVVAKNADKVADACMQKGTPVVSADEVICRACGTFTMTADYYQAGYRAGELAFEFMMGEKDISTTKLEYAPVSIKKYNKANCEALGINVPEGYTELV